MNSQSNLRRKASRTHGLYVLVRQRIAERIWNVAARLYYYWPQDLDNDPAVTPWWEATLTFQCTEAEADAAYDRMLEGVCGTEGHHHLAPCRFRCGGLRQIPESEVNGEGES